jgi:hypothetical protein
MADLDSSTLTTEELKAALLFTTNSLSPYDDVRARIKEIEESLKKLVGVDVLSSTPIMDCGRGRSFRPHGVMRCNCERFPDRQFAVYAFTEVSNGFGQGPIFRGQRGYVNYYSAKAVRFLRHSEKNY